MLLTNPVAPVAGILAAMSILAFVEALIPLRAAARSGRILPNLVLTFVTFATNAALNIPILLALHWAAENRIGLLNSVTLNPALALLLAMLALDFAWYLTHVAMHKSRLLWRFHAVHHSDAFVDVTTTIRQHPGEGLIRYVFMAVFALAVGASPLMFALYRLASALQGLVEHANIKLPDWLDKAICLITPSPNMHKVHHSRTQALTDSNYSNLFSIWDRLFGTFTPPERGKEIVYGLDEIADEPRRLTASGLLLLPFAKIWHTRETVHGDGVSA